MRPIDETKFTDFTVSRNGWNCTFSSLQTALHYFKELESGELYGNKPDGTRAILDSKQ